MPSPLSRLYSTVSTTPRRTVTDWPTAADTSTSASLAPRLFAASSERRATCSMASRESGSGAESQGWSGLGIGENETSENALNSGGGKRAGARNGRTRFYQQDAAQAADAGLA